MGSASESRFQPPPKLMEREPILPSFSSLDPIGEPTANPSPNPNPNPNPNPDPDPVPAAPPDGACSAMSIDGEEEDEALAGAEFLSREEVLHRRSRRLKQLKRCYLQQYWALMEEMRVKHRDYYWEFGKSPVEEESTRVGSGPRVREKGSSSVGDRKRCAYIGCKSKAMPLTSYCHPHILCDTKQTLYKACSYVIKCTQNGPQICAKPVLRAAIPSLCPVHSQKIQRQIFQALKKAGLNLSSSNKPLPKFHVLISECVRHIQAKRRSSKSVKPTVDTIANQDEMVTGSS
ncbi:hypothetical protein AXF42_Ash003346 [Apostasia shenzhenica]|uniref:KAT8 regulatory NSL complex subunit 2 n=1 Tax=Apostasia shenzhenica TaxID=1088818 RepID=A0A2I0BFX9_9ASPA|nr:hypothetical protein AXF42_Ash003346 [Apostasia shenzhenica]